jgi:hypothetical protein
MVGDDGLNFDVVRTNNPAAIDPVSTFGYTEVFVVSSGADQVLRAWEQWLLYVDPTPSGRAFDILDPHPATPVVRLSANRITTGTCADAEANDATLDVRVFGNQAFVIAHQLPAGTRRLEVWQLDARDAVGTWKPLCTHQVSLGSNFNKLSEVVDQTMFATAENGDAIEIDLSGLSAAGSPTAPTLRAGLLAADSSGFAGLNLTISMNSAGTRTIKLVSGRNDEALSSNDLVLLSKTVGSAGAFTTTATASGAFGTVARAGRFLFAGDGTRTSPFGFANTIPGYVNGFSALNGDLSTRSRTQSVRTPFEILPLGPYVFLFGESGIQTIRPTR